MSIELALLKEEEEEEEEGEKSIFDSVWFTQHVYTAVLAAAALFTGSISLVGYDGDG